LKPRLSEQWGIGEITGDSLWHREDVLPHYQLPYDSRHPPLCVGERPCFLIEAVGALLPLSPGKAKRSQSEYQKNGACCVSLAFEPHSGFRYVEVRDRRTAQDYADFLQRLLARHYPQAQPLRLVQDSRDTHTPGAFYEVLPPAEAFALGQRVEPHYTPKRAPG
jgi:DDE superfamily endonuclease